MNCLKHGVVISNIGGGCCSQSSLVLCRYICYNISIKIRQDNHFDSPVEFRIQHFCAHSIYQPLLNLDLRIFFSHSPYSFNKVSIRQLYNIGLGYNRHILFPIFSRVLKSSPGNPLASLSGLYLKVNGQILVYLDSLISPDIFSFNVLSEKCPVNILIRNPNGTDCSKQLQPPAQQTVG